MTVSPFEVERREFGRSPMGYNRGEVDAFLDEIRRSLAELWEERSSLRDEVERLTSRVASYVELEDQLKNTLLLAHDSAERAGEQARREAEVTTQEARQQARDIVHEAHEERQRLEQDTRELQSLERTTRARLRTLAQDVLQRVESDVVIAEVELTGDATDATAPSTGDVAAVASENVAVANQDESSETSDTGAVVETSDAR